MFRARRPRSFSPPSSSADLFHSPRRNPSPIVSQFYIERLDESPTTTMLSVWRSLIHQSSLLLHFPISLLPCTWNAAPLRRSENISSRKNEIWINEECASGEIGCCGWIQLRARAYTYIHFERRSSSSSSRPKKLRFFWCLQIATGGAWEFLYRVKVYIVPVTTSFVLARMVISMGAFFFLLFCLRSGVSGVYRHAWMLLQMVTVASN